MTTTLNTGGAIGADTLFGQCAKAAGHTVRHFSFAGHETECDPKDVVVVSDRMLRMADEPLKKANETLKRNFPSKNPYTNNLLRRNFWQIQNTDAVYAVAPLVNGKYIMGGTAWAVQMAIDRDIRPIYLFDLETAKWYWWRGHMDYWAWMSTQPYRPRDFETYTGIGSRKLTPEGEKAIRDLYAT